MMGGTFTMDLTAGVLGIGDECAAWGLTLFMCHKKPYNGVASSEAHLVLCDTNVHGDSAPLVFFPDR